MRDIVITRATHADAAAILDLQRRAFASEALRYPHDSLRPMVQTQNEMEEDIAKQICLKALDGEEIIGSVRASFEGDTCHVGRLIVAPEMQRQGIGSQLLQAIEGCARHARRLVLFTGSESTGQCVLYEQHGYQLYGTKQVSPTLTLMLFEKWVDWAGE